MPLASPPPHCRRRRCRRQLLPLLLTSAAVRAAPPPPPQQQQCRLPRHRSPESGSVAGMGLSRAIAPIPKAAAVVAVADSVFAAVAAVVAARHRYAPATVRTAPPLPPPPSRDVGISGRRVASGRLAAASLPPSPLSSLPPPLPPSPYIPRCHRRRHRLRRRLRHPPLPSLPEPFGPPIHTAPSHHRRRHFTPPPSLRTGARARAHRVHERMHVVRGVRMHVVRRARYSCVCAVHVSGSPAWMAVCRGRVRLRGGHAPRGVVSSPPCARGYPGAQ